MNLRKDLMWALLGLLFAALYTGGVVFLGYRWGHSDAQAIQAAWDKERTAGQIAAAKTEASNTIKTAALQGKFDKLQEKYNELLSTPPPSVSVATSASITAGTLKLRNEPTCPRSDAGANDTARSRAADAAATQALADRVSNSIAAVRVGDAATKREHDLDAQIIGLQQTVVAMQQACTVQGSATDGKY